MNFFNLIFVLFCRVFFSYSVFVCILYFWILGFHIFAAKFIFETDILIFLLILNREKTLLNMIEFINICSRR